MRSKDSIADLGRRDFLRLAGLGGVVVVAGFAAASEASEGALASVARGTRPGRSAKSGDFYFVQLSDTHWGFEGPAVNPDPKGTLVKAVAAVNALDDRPDFVVFTGDLTHTTDDGGVRRDRMLGFRDVVGRLKTKKVYFMAGEHDAALDEG